MKGEGIVQLMTMIAIKRSGLPLTRDIVFIGNADEELDSTGAFVFVDKHADLLKDVEFLMTEGGGNQVENGKLVYYGVGVAEKRTFWQRVSVKGTPSHGSRPTKLNPVPRLVAALDKIAKYETPLHVTPGVDKYFRDISRGYPAEQRGWLADVKKGLENPKARAWILNDVYWNAILRNTISLTGLQGSNKTNVIPAEATADIDVRLLARHRPAGVSAHAPADRRATRPCTSRAAPAQAAARESDRHRPVSRDRTRVAGARSERARDDADAHGRHRSAHVSPARHHHVRVRSVQGRGERHSDRHARQQRAAVGRERRIWIEVHVRRAPVRAVARYGLWPRGVRDRASRAR